jgi:hypothetical protein
MPCDEKIQQGPLMQSRLYFAYGSNLLSTRLTARCPSARALGVVTTIDWSVAFTKPGADGSGKAGLVSGNSSNHPGVIYEIAEADIPDLDRFEGLGHGYTRMDDFAVTSMAGESISCFTYMPVRHDPSLKPFDWYLALCIAGAHEHGFDDGVVGRFRKTPHQPDGVIDHPARTAGIEALNNAGHTNWQILLS